MVHQRNQGIHFQSGFFGFFVHHNPKDLGLICLVNKHKIHFRILSDLRIRSWIFSKKRTLGITGSIPAGAKISSFFSFAEDEKRLFILFLTLRRSFLAIHSAREKV